MSASVERVRHSGAIVLTELVTDGIGHPWFYSETFYGYNVREARSLFAESLSVVS